MEKPFDQYCALFEDSLNLDTSLLIERPPSLTDFDGLLKSWWSYEAVSVALVGPQGVGKTTQLHLLANGVPQPQEVDLLCPSERIKGEKALWEFLAQGLGFDAVPTSLPNAQDMILEGPRRIIFVDDAQLLWLRVMGGLEGLRHFISLIEATTPHCFWMAAFSQVCWQRLDYLLNISRHFSHVWEIPYFDRDELREALERRQKKSGLTLRFSEDIAKRQSSSGTDLKETFLKQICEASSGSFSAAAALWRKSATWDPKGKNIVMQSLEWPKKKLPDWLDPTTRSALMEILSHSYMTLAELSTVFLWDENETLAFLKPLLRMGLLEVRDNDHHRISDLYRPMVETVLSKAGLLAGKGL